LLQFWWRHGGISAIKLTSRFRPGNHWGAGISKFCLSPFRKLHVPVKVKTQCRDSGNAQPD
jgi:hypothetical protein